jgi:hypothetical protein
MRICAGIITWQDGDALTNAVKSVRDVVDEIVIADGLQDGIAPSGLSWHTKPWELAALKPTTYIQRLWRSQSEQRNWTLDLARELNCDWLLAIDADEELRNGAALREWLNVWHFDAFPLPFYFQDEQMPVACGFKCLHVPHWRRYVCQGSILENQRGEIVQVQGQTLWTHAREALMPYLVHRPELRSEERRSIRLSEHETTLEPYPDNVKAWLEPTYSPRLLTAPDGLLTSTVEAAELGIPIWYCAQCGRRYAGPGTCDKAHPPAGLEPLGVAA